MRSLLIVLTALVAACATPPRPARPTSTPAPAPTAPAPVDPELARCERNDWSSCIRYDDAVPESALARYDAGCDSGRAADCARLGLLSPAVHVRAASLERACAGGIARACRLRSSAWWHLASTAQSTTDRATSVARAVALDEQSCAADDMFACISLAVAYARGRLVNRDADRARGYAERVCATYPAGERCGIRERVACALTDSCPPVTMSDLPPPPPPPPPP